MRIVLMGQAAFGAKTLEALLDRGENVVAVYCPPDRAGGKADPTKEAALSRDIPVLQPSSYKNDQVFVQYQTLKPDLTVLAFVTDIIPARYFDHATAGAICYHPSILPRHRGASAINWAVIMGDERTGLTVFWPDGGIDTGPILLQKEIAISPDDTTGTLYFNHLFPMGIDALVESVSLIREKKAPKIAQNEAGATYEPPCDDRVASIDWEKPARTVYNLVRGCDPQPGAHSYINGEKVHMYGIKLHEESGQKSPGAILRIDGQGIHVAVAGGRIVVQKLRSGKGGKVSAADWAREKGVQEGDRFAGPA